mmetsp:Transcript_50299/g.99054  ORF Transcript_50299/g.99054 Transcript_50299/m.99054 type:complete len:103 (+) Transcript_50299:2467-2775(+)
MFRERPGQEYPEFCLRGPWPRQAQQFLFLRLSRVGLQEGGVGGQEEDALLAVVIRLEQGHRQVPLRDPGEELQVHRLPPREFSRKLHDDRGKALFCFMHIMH